MSDYFIIPVFIAIAFFGNYYIHNRYKKRKEEFFREIQGKKYDVIYDVLTVCNSKTKLSWNSNFSFGGNLFLSDIILIEKQIIIFFKIKMIKTITFNQSSVQLSELGSEMSKYFGIENQYFINKKENVNSKMKYKFSYKNKVNGINVNSEIIFNFKEREEDEKLILNFNNLNL